jgi:hypothetical protein
MGRGSIRFRVDRRQRGPCRMGAPLDHLAPLAPFAGAPQRHAPSVRLFRAPGSDPRCVAYRGFCGRRICRTADRHRAAHAHPIYFDRTGQRDCRGPSFSLPCPVGATPGRYRHWVCADQFGDPELSLHLGAAIHLLGSIRIRSPRSCLVARHPRCAVCAIAEDSGPRARGPGNYLLTPEQGDRRRVDRRGAGGRFRLEPRPTHSRRDLAPPGDPLHHRRLSDLRACTWRAGSPMCCAPPC